MATKKKQRIGPDGLPVMDVDAARLPKPAANPYSIRGDAMSGPPKFGSGYQNSPLQLPDRSMSERLGSSPLATIGATVANAFNPAVRKSTKVATPDARTVAATAAPTMDVDRLQIKPAIATPQVANSITAPPVMEVDRPPAAAPNSDLATIDSLKQRSAGLLRSMYARGTTPEQHAAMAADRAQLEQALAGYRRGLAPASAPTPITPESAAASKASLEAQAANRGTSSEFAGPPVPFDADTLDRMNRSREVRFATEQAKRQAGLQNAREFGSNYVGNAREADAALAESLRANTSGFKAQTALNEAVAANQGQSPQDRIANSQATMEEAKAAAYAKVLGSPEAAAAFERQIKADAGLTTPSPQAVDNTLQTAGEAMKNIANLGKGRDLVPMDTGLVEQGNLDDLAAAADVFDVLLGQMEQALPDHGEAIRANATAMLAGAPSWLSQAKAFSRAPNFLGGEKYSAVANRLNAIAPRLRRLAGVQG